MEPVGIAEIAARLAVKRATVDVWRSRGVLPDPRWTISGSPAWEWETIEKWAREHNRWPKDRVEP